MKATFAEKVLVFYRQLGVFTGLPEGIEALNPYKDGSATYELAARFYEKFYADTASRYLIIGINPGRFGGAVTGVPFTDPKRYIEQCGLEYNGMMTHEPSSVFVYEMIDAFGGPAAFYSQFYINSMFPLALTYKGKNYNYYDSAELSKLLRPAIIENLKQQISLGTARDICFCLGKKNYEFLQKLNLEYQFFKEVIPLEHPRYIVQYRSKDKAAFIQKYLMAFHSVGVK